MFPDPTAHAAAIFAGIATVLTAIAFAFGTSRRRGLLPMLLIVLIGLAIVTLRDRLVGWFATPSTDIVLRELGLAIMAFGIINIGVLFAFQTLFARRGIPKILDDMFLVLGLVVYGIYRLDAVGVNLAGIITTSAVLTGAIAFSAKEMLGNLWGGIALQVEKTCRIGDWVRIDHALGQVVSIRWRYMAIATIENETIVIPNANVMKDRITVIARRGEESHPWIRFLPFELEFDHSPEQVVVRIERAFADAEIPNVGRTQPVRVTCTAFQESGIQYQVQYALLDPSLYVRTDSMVRVHLYAALARAGLGIPFPRRVIEMRPDTRPEEAQREQVERLGALQSSDLFAALTREEMQALTPTLAACLYAGGDVIFHAGEKADSLYLLTRGEVRVVGDDRGNRYELARLTAPSYFGEMGLLLGQPRIATVIADGEAMCYRLDRRGFDIVMQARPELAETLAKVLAKRQAENDATVKALDADARARHASNRTSDLVRKIQQFFLLDPAQPRGSSGKRAATAATADRGDAAR